MCRPSEPLPPPYGTMPKGQAFERIRRCRERLGQRVVILAHHYQSDEVVQFADFTGDSLKLSQLAADQKQAEVVVFCGVHFMAESADILTAPNVQVVLPDPGAGCDMAEQATIEQVERAWSFLAVAARGKRIIPVTYVNSSAAIKAFCGRHGGACCTSGNASAVIDWALSRGDKVLFMPDQHLGRNTLYQMDCPLDNMLLYRPTEPNGGLTERQVAGALAILWDGFCPVHMLFTKTQCDQIRQTDPACRILVHPECRWEVFRESDMSGSTELIIQTIDHAPSGSRWAIGTESHLVDRLAARHAGRLAIRSLCNEPAACESMNRIDAPRLLWILENLCEGRVLNRVVVEEPVRGHAIKSLERMLVLKVTQPIKG
jgi:quinolinate synthase